MNPAPKTTREEVEAIMHKDLAVIPELAKKRVDAMLVLIHRKEKEAGEAEAVKDGVAYWRGRVIGASVALAVLSEAKTYSKGFQAINQETEFAEKELEKARRSALDGVGKEDGK
jgi:hypothetical protein